MSIAAGSKAGKEVVEDFYSRFKDEELVVNKWLGVVAAESLDGAKKAVAHESFAITNPNKVRSVMRKFSANQTAFHAKDGSGYEFVADMAVKLDGLNPLVAADTVKPLTSWRKFDPERQGMMKAALEKVLAKSGLSKNVYEVVSKSLDDTGAKKTRILENKAKLQKRAKTDAFMKRGPVKTYASGARAGKEPAYARGVNGARKPDVATAIAATKIKER